MKEKKWDYFYVSRKKVINLHWMFDVDGGPPDVDLYVLTPSTKTTTTTKTTSKIKQQQHHHKQQF